MKRGFTLIEVSIVLVIIGLIVGGVMLGRDLIASAQIRATISQWEKFNVAAQTFRGKYNGLPGDIRQGTGSPAANLGLFSMTTNDFGVAGGGDANGILNGTLSAEAIVFWRHLGDTGLIASRYAQNLNGNGQSTIAYGGTGQAPMNDYLPKAAFGVNSYWVVYVSSGVHFYEVSRIDSITATSVWVTTGGTGFTPIEASQIDSKIDDNLPASGIVQARGTVQWNPLFDRSASSAAGGTNACVNSTPSPTTYSAASGALCNVKIKASF